MAEIDNDVSVDKQTEMNMDNGTTPLEEVDQTSSKTNLKAEPFKKPLLIIGPQRGKSHKSLNNFYRTVKEPDDKPSDHCNEVGNKITDVPQVGELRNDELKKVNASKITSDQQKPLHPLAYKEPEWGGFPLAEYKLEELKSGTIVKTIELKSRSFSVFGRLEHCDIPMLHPTVSRYHAVLQYRSVGDEQNEPGFYIYDLGSSLGTFLNKQKLKPKIFVRVKVGHVLKIGCSTRMFILQGPEDDEEPESDLSVTELKQLRQERLAAAEAERAQAELEEEERVKKEEERGIDWGMGEDADEETDLTENPYAATQNEELYLEDPKKTLRGWFDREGEELEYDVQEKGFGHFLCRIELPLDNGGGGNLVAEANVKGKKKEAVVQAALEACRLLDRQGLLRQSTQESKKRAAKDWEAVDFYDSDEDNFLDRTGHIEKKRQQRMAQSGKLEKEVETYDSLVVKYSAIVKELEESENKLNEMLSLAAQANRGADDEDDLDAYMSTLKQAPTDKIEIKRMKAEVVKLRMEENKIRRLVNIARPTELPKLEPPVKPSPEKKVELPHVMVGKRAAGKKRTHQETVLPLETTKQQAASDVQEEEEEEEEEEEKDKEEEKPQSENVETGENELKEVTKKKRSRADRRTRPTKDKPMQMDSEDFSNCTWAPPVGQTGDGRTSLNDKLGY